MTRTIKTGLIGKKLRDRRRSAGMTQDQLADAVGILQSNLARFERQERAGSTVDMVKRLADALGCKVDDLIG